MPDIHIHGVREHNLCNLDLTLPRQALIAFTGRSGSGKSSLAFDTLHAEAQRRFVDVLALHSRGLTRGLRRPDVDEITGLPPTIALDQRYRAPSPLTTVGTWSEAHAVLAVLMGRAGVQHCPTCDVAIRPVAHDAIVKALLALPEGTRLHLEAPLHGSPQDVLDEVQRAGFSRIRVQGEVVRLDEVNAASVSGDVRVVVDRMKISADREDRLHDAVRLTARAGQGAVIAHTPDGEQIFVDRPWCLNCARALPDLSPRLFSIRSPLGQCGACVGSGRVDDQVCGVCNGARLREEALAVRFAGVGIGDLLSQTLDELAGWIATVPTDAVSKVVLTGLRRRIQQLRRLGLGAVNLGRGCDRLSTGEFQRLRLARQLGAALSGVLYVVDEPGAGLGPKEIPAVVQVLRELVEQGNTVLVVTHQRQIIAASDEVIDFGPGAGVAGGRLLYQGPAQGLLEQDSPSGDWLSGRRSLSPGTAKKSAVFRITGLNHPPFVDAAFSLPLGQVVALHGPSGCGKSRFLQAIRAHIAEHLTLKGETPPKVRSLK
ncbi:MAG: hypothetical protein GWP91_15525, partial [Rhodobacterales bacterium]|nr:hypothetical protein [Rhodobacterales bacterium]